MRRWHGAIGVVLTLGVLAFLAYRLDLLAGVDVQSVLKVTISTLFKINSLWMDKSVSRCNSITFCSFPIFVRILPQNDHRHVICHSERAILNSGT